MYKVSKSIITLLRHLMPRWELNVTGADEVLTVAVTKCKCLNVPEMIQHITAGCTVLAHDEYLHRHNCVGRIVHQRIAQSLHLVQDDTPYYHTGRFQQIDLIIVLVDKRWKKTFLVDIAIPNSTNMQSAIATKITKYGDLAREVKQQQWRQKSVTIVPIVISAT
ncbi:hypothetical protein ILUMI_23980, partial [Ignelater luminosus]